MDEEAMRKSHIAFIVESAYGHIIPTLAVASELIRRGHRVSYAVKDSLSRGIANIGVECVVYKPLENKLRFQDVVTEQTRTASHDLQKKKWLEIWKELDEEEISDTMSQLETLYRRDRPSLIVYDLRNLAGRKLAARWGVPAIEHSPLLINNNETNSFEDPYDTELVLVSLPRFFQKNSEALDERFHFIGFSPLGRAQYFQPWVNRHPTTDSILVNASTGGVPQVEFLRTAVDAFSDLPMRLVLSLGPMVDQDSLGTLPNNVVFNRVSSNLDILPNCSLFVGLGGQGSVLEALYCGVPTLIAPPSADSPLDDVALRVQELHIGDRLEPSTLAALSLRQAAESLMQNTAVLQHARSARQLMLQDDAPTAGADLIEARLAVRSSPF
jgi:NDP-glycosyltransferase